MQVVDLARTDPQSTALVVQKWLGGEGRPR
jgi:hypothetical protein